MANEMSDAVLLSFMKPVAPEDIAKRSTRGPSDFFPRLAKLFIASGDQAMEIDYKKMHRKFAAVAQSLRLALKNTSDEKIGVPLSELAWVSVNGKDQTVYLRMRTEPAKPDEGRKSPGRPRKQK